MVQYDLSYLAVIDRNTDEAIAVTTVCFYALFQMESRCLNYDQFDFVELEKAEYDTYICMGVVPYKEIFRFLVRRNYNVSANT